jgi:transcriptional regulator with XRE-family HTH domain
MAGHSLEQNKRIPSLASLGKLAQELGVSIDFLVAGKDGVITDTIPAIEADKRLNLEVKKALLTLVQALRADDIGNEAT